MPQSTTSVNIGKKIKQWGHDLGFKHVGISGIHLKTAEKRLFDWLEAQFHGEMDYMTRHSTRRSRPEELVPGTLSVISVSLDYLPEAIPTLRNHLSKSNSGYISCYSLGRDYHKVVRRRLAKLAKRIEEEIGIYGYRVFCDSAPVLEKALAEQAGIGWIGKHTNLIHRNTGSFFFIGEIYTNLTLPFDTPVRNHCGSCTACLHSCPTRAIVAPYQLDARRCISYLTIELQGAIPEEFRSALGNRIYGCDDCQLVCPWNRYARITSEKDFHPREHFHRHNLIEFFSWNEVQFLKKTEGSAIRRIGYERWLRNIAVALGNAVPSFEVVTALERRLTHPSELVREHVQWALRQQQIQ